jgi:hypothetical protein
MDEFLKWLKDDWKNRRFILINEVIAFVTGLGAAVYLSFMLDRTNYLLLYTVYTINALTAIVACAGRHSTPMLLTNVGYLLLDAYALYGMFLKSIARS